jgi:hypothetical protein
MEQLDAALAKLTSASPAKVQDSDVTVKCALCGAGFSNPIQLGEHVAVCTGFDEDTGEDATGISDAQNYGATEIKAAALSAPGFLQFLEGDNNLDSNTSDDGDFEEYEDYDVDAAQEGVDYQFQEISAYPSVEEVEKAGEKWDGKGLFQANVEVQIDLTPKQRKYLNHYQTIHDDEQVDTNLLLEVLHYINRSSYGEGAILVFLPGWQEISEFQMLLENTVPFSNRSRFLVLPLHSGIPSADQRKVLRRPPPGVRKIVLSTPIAETSLTIDDVAFVVDTGRAKEKDYDPHLKTSTLQPTWVSQASSKQRKGRAGRTKAGVCFHLFSSRRYQSMRPFIESELLRTPLVRRNICCGTVFSM